MNRLAPSILLAFSCAQAQEPLPAEAPRPSPTTNPTAPAACYESATEVEVVLQAQIVEECAFWNSLAMLPGQAMVEKQAGSLTIDFLDGVVFAGDFVDGEVSLTYIHEHPFEDGCQWAATETLVGRLDEETCTLRFNYDYQEAVVVSDGSCAPPCAAEAQVDLELTPNVAKPSLAF